MRLDATQPPPEPAEALRWFRARVPITKTAWLAMTAEARGRAFTLAGVARLSAVSDVWRALDKSIASGGTLADFKRKVAPTLLKEWNGTVANPSARMELIFRNATQRAAVHGRVEQLRDPAVARSRPYWMFDAVGDARSSEICKALDGTVLLATDPFWATHTPPCHHACRSTIRGLRASDAKARGIAAKAPATDAQKGFGALPGAEEWEPRERDYPPEVWAAHREPSLKESKDDESTEPATGDVPTSDELRERSLKAAGLEGFVKKHPLRRFDVVDFNADPDRDPGAVGEYLPGRAELFVHSRRPIGSFSRSASTAFNISARASTLADAMERTAVHELAHHVREFLGHKLRTSLEAVFVAAKAHGLCITKYAQQDVEEYFAECLTAYVYHPGELREHDPDGYDIIEQALRKVR